MKPRLLSFLRCPACKSELNLQVFQDETGEILDGILTCQGCPAWFPIIGGIPRMILAPLQRDLILIPHTNFLTSYKNLFAEHIVKEWSAANQESPKRSSLKVRTARSFGYEWNTFLAKTLREKINVYRRDFLAWITPISEQFFKDKVVLETGCGVGRHTYLAAQLGPKELIAIDLSEAVWAAYKNTKEFANVHVIQADIYHLPFLDIFDYIFSIGVLHHLPQPEEGFYAVASHLKKGGTISIWVYGRRNNFFHVYFNETLRVITRRIPHRLLHLLCYIPASGIVTVNFLYMQLKKYRLTAPLARLMPFKIYADLPFIVKLNDTFDVFATPRSTYWKREEIEQWFDHADMRDYHVSEFRGNSLQAYGIR